MDGMTLLQEAYTAGLVVTVEGGALKIRGPRQAAPVAQKLIDHKPEVVSALQAASVPRLPSGAVTRPAKMTSLSCRHWDDEAQELVAFFQRSWPMLPRAPFRLTPWMYISDPEKWYRSLGMDVSAGPLGCRARMGVLQEDLRRLRDYISSRFTT